MQLYKLSKWLKHFVYANTLLPYSGVTKNVGYSGIGRVKYRKRSTGRILLTLTIGLLIIIFIMRSQIFSFLFEANTNSNAENFKLPTIFVSIASYRDSQCSITIENMMQHAQYPERIFVGVYQQNGNDDSQCDDGMDKSAYAKWLHDNYRVTKVHYRDGKGPATARWWCAQLYRGEDYFFQIDSHMRFVDKWDTLMINEQNAAAKQFGHRKVVLSHYPLEFKVEDGTWQPDAEAVTSKFCNVIWNTDDMIQPLCGIISIPSKYEESGFAAGGLMFAPGSIVSDVPFDRDLDYLFHGEELLYSIRLYAAGYRMCHPLHNNVFHYYSRSNFPKIWTDTQDFFERSQNITNRVKRTLLLSNEAGSKTSIALDPADVLQWYERFGFTDPINNKTSPQWC